MRNLGHTGCGLQLLPSPQRVQPPARACQRPQPPPRPPVTLPVPARPRSGSPGPRKHCQQLQKHPSMPDLRIRAWGKAALGPAPRPSVAKIPQQLADAQTLPQQACLPPSIQARSVSVQDQLGCSGPRWAAARSTCGLRVRTLPCSFLPFTLKPTATSTTCHWGTPSGHFFLECSCWRSLGTKASPHRTWGQRDACTPASLHSGNATLS